MYIYTYGYRCIYIYIYVYVCVYIYIYREREIRTPDTRTASHMSSHEINFTITIVGAYIRTPRQLPPLITRVVPLPFLLVAA